MGLVRPCFRLTAMVLVTVLSLVMVSAAPKVLNHHQTEQVVSEQGQRSPGIASGSNNKASAGTVAAGNSHNNQADLVLTTSPYLPLALWSRARATLEANQQKIAHLTSTPGYHLALFAHSNSPLKKQLTPLWDAVQSAFPRLNFTSVDTRLLPSTDLLELHITSLPAIVLFHNDTAPKRWRTASPPAGASNAWAPSFDSLTAFITNETGLQPATHIRVVAPELDLFDPHDVYLYLSSMMCVIAALYYGMGCWGKKDRPPSVFGFQWT